VAVPAESQQVTGEDPIMFRRKTEASRRHVILHYHFFKNAGSTVESILKNNFRNRFARLDSDDFNSTVPNDALLDFLTTHPEVVAVSSHHLRPPKPVDVRFIFHDMLFLRHPVARLWSVYEFYRRTDLETDDPLATAARTRDAQEFFQLLTEEYPHHVNNAQVNLLANAGEKLPTESDLAVAADVISQATVLGLAELFDESTVSAENSLGRAFEGLDFSHVRQNVSDGRPMSLDDQLARFRKHCGTEIFDRVIKLNQLDLALVQMAQEEVSRRFRLVSDYGRRLKTLRSKCAARETAATRIIIASNHPASFALYASPDSA
jgi:hypothetical protein